MKRFTLLTFVAAAFTMLAVASCNVSDDSGTSLLPPSECPGGQTLCSGVCYDLNTSVQACGTCGVSCGDGEVCNEGVCTLGCAAGYVACGDQCVNPQNDSDWCGATDPCDTSDTSLQCAEGEICSAGTCELVCTDGTVECDGRCVDPDVDREFCGAEGNCSGGNIGETCSPTEVCDRGVCDDTCPDDSVPCDGGCIDPQTNPRFCGASDTCEGANAGVMCAGSEICQEGVCVTECGPNQLLCDGSCIDPMTSTQYCGAVETCVDAQAGETCGLGESCLGGTCFPTDYAFFSPFDAPGTRTHPRDLAYRVDTLVDGMTMHYTTDNTNPVPDEGTTISTDDYIETDTFTNDTYLRVVFEYNETLSGVSVIRHLTNPDLEIDVNTPDNFSLNGGGIIATVEPGDEVNVTFDTLFWKYLAETTGQAVYYTDGVGVIHCESLTATPPGVSKSLDLTFNAPEAPGTYRIYSGISYEDDCAAVTEMPENASPHAVVKVR